MTVKKVVVEEVEVVVEEVVEEFETVLLEISTSKKKCNFTVQLEEELIVSSEFLVNLQFALLAQEISKRNARANLSDYAKSSKKGKKAGSKAKAQEEKDSMMMMDLICYIFEKDAMYEIIEHYSEVNGEAGLDYNIKAEDFTKLLMAIIDLIIPKASSGETDD